MKPFIFQFKENATEQGSDLANVVYDGNLNLSVDTETGAAAIDSVNLETETFTKDQYDVTDVDRNGFSALLETETRTFTQTEASDSDRNSYQMSSLLATETHTRTHLEVTDTD